MYGCLHGTQVLKIIMSMLLGVLRSAPSACAFALGMPRSIGSPRGLGHTREALRAHWPPEIGAVASFLPRRSFCLWNSATQAATDLGEETIDVEGFEDELDAMVADIEDSPHTEDVAEHVPPPRLSLLQSNIGILESDCEVAQLLLDAAKARRDHLYLGLDISTQSTGYTVLRPSATAPVGVASGGSLQGVGEAKLMEWGCIVGSGSGSKKRDVVDVGMVVEKRLKEVAARCSADADVDASPGVASGGSDDNAKSSPDVVWVVGVEDFMRRFLPGRSNAKSIFALAQLNGIVKYACQKPEGKDMKQIVHDFAVSQENGDLQMRYDWPLSSDGSLADSSYDVTDAYLVARYSWHRDIFRAVADDTLAKERFMRSFRTKHADKLIPAEERAVKIFMDGDMPAARGKKKLKPMTERSARNAHRKLEDVRLTKAYETALLRWFKDQVLPKEL